MQENKVNHSALTHNCFSTKVKRVPADIADTAPKFGLFGRKVPLLPTLCGQSGICYDTTLDHQQ